MAGCYVAFHKQLGDLTLLQPALERLRRHHGGPVRVLTRRGHADLVSLIPGAVYQAGPALTPATHGYAFDPLSKSALRLLLAPVANKVLVTPERRELRWFHRVVFPPFSGPELGDDYVAEFFWNKTPVPGDGPFHPPVLSPPPESWAPPGFTRGTFVLVNPTAGWKVKMWTAPGWAEVLAAQAAAGPFVLTHGGQAWQREHCEEVCRLASEQARIVGTTLREFLWLCANARAVLTVDGAASHFAAAFGVPALTLFGPTNIHQWHLPRPDQVAVRAPADSRGRRRLSALGSDEVIRAADQLLAGGGK